jgi:hypothetical protein
VTPLLYLTGEHPLFLKLWGYYSSYNALERSLCVAVKATRAPYGHSGDLKVTSPAVIDRRGRKVDKDAHIMSRNQNTGFSLKFMRRIDAL